MRWDDIHKCREWMAELAIERHFEIKLNKNESYRYSGKCKAEGCPWRFYIRRVPHSITMQCNVVEGEHNCCFDKQKETNKMAKASWIAKVIEKKMRMHYRSFRTRDVMSIIWRKHQLRIKYWQAWKAKGLALEMVHGNYEESYAKVAEFCRQILKVNPGSIAAYSRDETYK
ncbi:Mudr family transposase, partial [Thalictrum thalictroides]